MAAVCLMATLSYHFLSHLITWTAASITSTSSRCTARATASPTVVCVMIVMCCAWICARLEMANKWSTTVSPKWRQMVDYQQTCREQSHTALSQSVSAGHMRYVPASRSSAMASASPGRLMPRSTDGPQASMTWPTAPTNASGAVSYIYVWTRQGVRGRACMPAFPPSLHSHRHVRTSCGELALLHGLDDRGDDALSRCGNMGHGMSDRRRWRSDLRKKQDVAIGGTHHNGSEPATRRKHPTSTPKQNTKYLWMPHRGRCRRRGSGPRRVWREAACQRARGRPAGRRRGGWPAARCGDRRCCRWRRRRRAGRRSASSAPGGMARPARNKQ